MNAVPTLRSSAAVLAVLALSALGAPRPAGAAEADARLFAAHALALRAAGVAGEKPAADVLARAPGLDAAAAAPVLWGPFFENAIVKLGRLGASRPAALYYNPLLDAALVTFWERRGRAWRVASVRALPGERLEDSEAEAPPRPAWTVAPEGPLQALAAATAARLAAFGRAHPEAEKAPGRSRAAFAAAARDMQVALARVVGNAVRRARRATTPPPWLGPALARVGEALAAGDAAALRAAAPDTDVETAAALVGMPAGFVGGLTLDMALDAGGGESLLVGSLPDDGDIYVFALCRRGAGDCALRRFMLVSLSGRVSQREAER